MAETPAPQPGDHLRARRSCHAVPGSNPRFLEKAQGLESDQVFLDLEDSVAPIAKPDARKNIVEVLNTGDWGKRVRTVRVNDWTTQWTYKDVIEVVEGAGANLDCIMLPKVQTADQVKALDVLLTQIETTMGYEVGRIGIEAQIENALGLINVDDIATASPAHRDDHLRARRLHGLDQHEVPGRRRAAARVRRRRRLPLHPDAAADGGPGPRQAGHRRALPADQGPRRLPAGRRPLRRPRLRRQVDPAPRRRSRSPTRCTPRTRSDYDHAENILDAYEYYTSEKGGAKGAVMLGDEMIDEASRKMALVISGKGRAAGMQRSDVWRAPNG